MFFIGRVRAWPVAREGAQKLKEISYVHAEAYQASELKHGPLALIDSSMPSVVLVPDDELLSKNISTIEQIKARGGPVIAVTQQRPARRPGQRGHPRPAQHAGAGPHPAHDPAADVRLQHGRQARPRHRQAPQPSQERHRGVAVLPGTARR